MNILFYLHQYPGFGGIETSTSILGQYFYAHGCRVYILAHKKSHNTYYTGAAEDIIPVIYMPDKNRLVSRENKIAFANTVRLNLVDVILYLDSYALIENNVFDNPYMNHQVPIIVSERSCPLNLPEKPRIHSNFLYDAIRIGKFLTRRSFHYLKEKSRRRWLYARSSRYVLHSTRFFGEFRSITRLKDIRKLRAIPNALGLHVVDRASLGTIENLKTILFVGTLCKRKGCHYLLHAWRELQPLFPAWNLVILGDGPQRTELEIFARNHGLHNVTFKGYQKDVLSYYRNASILAFPSEREGWGLVLVEAMSQGVVPVCFNSYSSIYDIVDDGLNGIIVPAFDISYFCNALHRLMESPDVLLQMSTHALVKAFQHDITLIGERWLCLFREVISEISPEPGHHSSLCSQNIDDQQKNICK